MAKYNTKYENYQAILETLEKGLPVGGGDIKFETSLFSSEVSKYTRELVNMGAVERITGGRCKIAKNKILPKGAQMLQHLKALHELMNTTGER